MQTTTGSQPIIMKPNALPPGSKATETPVLALAQSASQSLRALIGLKLAPLGLVIGQDRVLNVLEQKGSMSVSQLADEVNVRPSTVSKMMDRLEVRGLAVRSHDVGDARRTNVELTDAGKAVCKNLRVLYGAIESELQSDFSDEDTQSLIKGLALLDEAVGRRLKRLR